ncbi:MAG: FAD-dependent oxidoreductase [bacterium]
MAKEKIVIIGGGACGAKVAARARRNAPDVEIVMIEEGPYVSYAGCGMPYYIAGAVEHSSSLMSMIWGTVRDERYFKDSKDVTVYTNTKVQSIEPDNKTIKIVTKTGDIKTMNYTKLVLATGARARVPGVKGTHLKNVFVLRNLEQAEEIRRTIESEVMENAVIVGAGRIGLELADAFNAQGLNITIIEMADQVLPDVLDSEMALYPANTLREEKVKLYLNETVKELVGDENGKIKTVITDKRSIDTDIVIFAVGIEPNVDLARSIGIRLGKTGAILVNEFMQTSIEDIYAGGDCVECKDIITGNSVYTPLGSVANKHGRVIANNITGIKDRFPGVLSACILMSLGLKIGKTGLTEKQAKNLGYQVETCLTVTRDISHFLAGSKNIVTKLIVSKQDKRLLGAQILGPGDVARRLDIVTTAITFGAKIDEVSMLDLCYAPPFSTAMDSIIHSANVMCNKLSGSVNTITPYKVKSLLQGKDDFVLLDLRTKEEISSGKSIDDRRVFVYSIRAFT